MTVEPKKTTALTSEQQAVIAAHQKRRNELGMSDREYFDKHMPGCGSYWTYFHICKGKYTGNIEKWIRKYQSALLSIADLQIHRFRGQQPGPSVDFKPTHTSEAVFNTIAQARERTDEMRIVILKAPFGGGKSTICREIARRYPDEALIVRARQSWQTSYMPGPRDICSALGRDDAWRSVEKCESAMYAELRRARRILCVDDANTISPSHCNMFRDIVEECPNTVVLLALLPAFFDKLKYKAYWESAQMTSRTLCVIPAEDINPDNVAAFMDDLHFNGSSKDAFKLVAKAANQYAGFRMVKRVRELLMDEFTRDEEVPIEGVIRAVATAEKMFASNPEESLT